MSRDEIDLSLDVPGTPEQVWEAISTGPGISAWFVPAELEDGALTSHHGPGLDFTAPLTAFEPGRRLAFGDGTVATEFLLEARAGGACSVRIVSSGGDAEWFERVERGWRDCLAALRLYLAHSAGRPAGSVYITGGGVGDVDATWAALTSALGVAPGGERVVLEGGGGRLAGRVLRREPGTLMVELDDPAPGLLMLFAFVFPGADGASVRLQAHLYGEHGPALAARDEPGWRAWVDAHFPPGWSAAGLAARA